MNFKKMLMSQIGEVETEPEIRAIAQKLKSSGMFPGLDEKIYNEALDTAIRTIEIEAGVGVSITGKEPHKKWFDLYYKDLGVTRWDRYTDYLTNQKGFPKKVVQTMKENLFAITDLLGDPNGEHFKRKGLIVGDVQSGKTANYVGLMNLATDAKYKVIVVLTGTTNTLREQTQIRIEEGLGIAGGRKGVKTIRNSDYEFHNLDPVYLTSIESDFTRKSQNNFQASIETTTVPIVLVTKKNVSALKNIYGWLDEYSRKKGNTHIDSSLLLIDDEADFASVNTKDEEDPTSINKKIREILELFTRSSYIGFTATPYANIFIDPDNKDDMERQDLFPKDYIYVLGESSEYVGVQSIFSEDEELATNKHMLVQLQEDEVETYLPLKHKKMDNFCHLSESMKEAIHLFFIANVVRDLREHKMSHRSMLLNISRFTNMHEKIKTVVVDYVERLKKDIRLYGKLPYEEALEIESIKNIQKSYQNYYAEKLSDDYPFEEILSNMNDSIYRIKVAIVNGKEKEVNYLGKEDEGERVIVIGGFALSRGLTLEGLMISYYFRNSVMYDSLLQMGRWFGYRNGYEDLCRIFMTPKAISDFTFIALATKELKEDLAYNAKRGLTPLEFGVKVRSGQVGLIITARNKMGAAHNITADVNFSKDLVETTVMNVSNEEKNAKNKQVIMEFVEENKNKITHDMYPGRKEGRGIRGLEKAQVISLIEQFIAEETSSRYDGSLMIKWLRENDDSLKLWDLVFVTGENEDVRFDYGNGINGPTSNRTVIKHGDVEGLYKNGRYRLGSPSDGKYGLNFSQVEEVKRQHQGDKTISQIEYFISEINRAPIVYIYSVVPHIDEDSISEPIPLLSIGIPDLGGKSKFVNYTVNKIYQDIEKPEREEE